LVHIAIHIAIAKKINPTSLVSFIAFLKRIIERAQTSEKALAIFDPTINIIIATIIHIITSVIT
jgi:hypothetical protein